MTSNFRFVPDTTEGDALEGTVQGFGDREAEGGFSDAGGAYETGEGNPLALRFF